MEPILHIHTLFNYIGMFTSAEPDPKVELMKMTFSSTQIRTTLIRVNEP